MTETDLRNLLATACPGGVITVPAGIYPTTAAVDLTVPGCRYLMNGVTLQRQGTGTILQISAGGVSIDGMTLDTAVPAGFAKAPKVGTVGIIVRAINATISNLTTRILDTGLMLYPGQRGLVLNHAHMSDDLRGDGIYFGGGLESEPRGDVFINDLVIDATQNEHALRCSTSGCSNVEIRNSFFRNWNGKETVAPRIANGFRFYDCTIDGPLGVFIGEGGANADPATWSSNLEFHRCQITGGGNLCIRENVHGVLAEDVSVFIDASVPPGQEQVAVVINASSDGLIASRIHREVLGATPKPYIRQRGAATQLQDLGGHSTNTLTAKPPAAQARIETTLASYRPPARAAAVSGQ